MPMPPLLLVRSLHYALDASAAPALAASGFRPEWLQDLVLTPQRAELVPSACSALTSIALHSVSQSGHALDAPALFHRFLVGSLHSIAVARGEEPPKVQADAEAVLTAALRDPGDGTDIAWLHSEVHTEYKRAAAQVLIHHAAKAIPSDDPDLVLRLMSTDAVRLVDEGNGHPAAVRVGGDPEARWGEYIERSEGRGALKYIPTGFNGFDGISHGLHPGLLVLVCGATRLGKSVFRAAVMLHMWRSGYGAAEVLRESTVDDACLRLECMEMALRLGETPGGLASRLRRGELADDEAAVYASALIDFQRRRHPFTLIAPQSYTSLAELESQIAALKQHQGLTVLGVDALHSQTVDDRWNERDDLRQGAVAEWLKDIAVRYELIVIGEVQEQQATVSSRVVPIQQLVKYSQRWAHVADVFLRLFPVPEVSPWALAGQVLKNKTSTDDYWFPIHFDRAALRMCDGKRSVAGQAEQAEALQRIVAGS